jgi:outer membrane lipoprotein SlyB
MANNNKGLYTGLASGAISGATAGSVVPGWGNLIGGVVGAVAGGIGGYENDQKTQEQTDAANLAAMNSSQFGENKTAEAMSDEERKQGMAALQYLASQRASAQANGNLRSFRNSITG